MNILFTASDISMSSGAFLCMIHLCNILKHRYNHNVHILFSTSYGDGYPLLEKLSRVC